MGMSYEDKMRILSWVKPEKKDRLLARMLKGERVNIQGDEDLFFHVNRERLSLEDQMKRDKYKPLADHVKNAREVVDDKKYGFTKDKKMRYLGEIPADIYFTHPWFSPNLSKLERDANIRKFFAMFPAFRIGDKA